MCKHSNFSTFPSTPVTVYLSYFSRPNRCEVASHGFDLYFSKE